MKVASTSFQCGYTVEPLVLLPSPMALTAPGGTLPGTIIKLRLMNGAEEVSWAKTLDIPEIPEVDPPNKTTPDSSYGTIRYRAHPQGYQIAGTVNSQLLLTVGVVTASGDTFTAVVPVTPVQQGGEGTQGQQGKPGPFTPPPALWSDYPLGFQFQSGADGEDYRHCVIHGTAANGKALSYICTKSHAKADGSTPGIATNAPGTPGGSACWKAVEGGPFSLLSTEVILAAGAFINLLSTRGLRVYAPNGINVALQLTGQGAWPLLAGSTDPAQAHTKLSSTGDLYAQNAYIQGEIHATSGIFEGSILQRFKPLAQSNATQSSATSSYPGGVYTLGTDLNVIADDTGQCVRLPSGSAFHGYIARVACPVTAYTRSSQPVTVTTADGSPLIGRLTASQSSMFTAGSYASKSLEFTTGIAEFIALPSNGVYGSASPCLWFLRSIQASYARWL